jgi:thiol-disulfide isomerase/thioredoxin
MGCPETGARFSLKIVLVLFLSSPVFLLVAPQGLAASERQQSGTGPVRLYLFWGKGCPHCNEEREFLMTLKQKYPTLEIKDYEVWYDKQNALLFGRIIKAAGGRSAGVPGTVIGSRVFIGFNVQTARAIEDAITLCRERGCPDAMELIARPPADLPREEPKVFTLPFFGDVDPSKMSLPLFTVIIGGLDSFNPCAFFVLLFLLSLLIHARSRQKMLVIGGIFVLFSGIIYFIFMAAWLNIFMIIGQLTAITLTAGLIALATAAINIKDFFFFHKGISLSIPEQAKPRLFERMRNLLKSPSFPAMVAGTVVLAVTANAYELLCTAGFPMIYTRVLTLHKLTAAQYYLFLVLYNVVYVLPLSAIVIVITVTLGARKLTEWQGRKLKIISGLMMLSLGIVLIINPALLNNVLAAAALLGAVLVVSWVAITVTKKLRPEIAAD